MALWHLVIPGFMAEQRMSSGRPLGRGGWSPAGRTWRTIMDDGELADLVAHAGEWAVLPHLPLLGEADRCRAGFVEPEGYDRGARMWNNRKRYVGQNTLAAVGRKALVLDLSGDVRRGPGRRRGTRRLPDEDEAGDTR